MQFNEQKEQLGALGKSVYEKAVAQGAPPSQALAIAQGTEARSADQLASHLGGDPRFDLSSDAPSSVLGGSLDVPAASAEFAGFEGQDIDLGPNGIGLIIRNSEAPAYGVGAAEGSDVSVGPVREGGFKSFFGAIHSRIADDFSSIGSLIRSPDSIIDPVSLLGAVKSAGDFLGDLALAGQDSALFTEMGQEAQARNVARASAMLEPVKDFFGDLSFGVQSWRAGDTAGAASIFGDALYTPARDGGLFLVTGPVARGAGILGGLDGVAPSIFARQEIVSRLGSTMQQHLDTIATLDPNARVGFRGSLARGFTGPHKGNVPFNPQDFDVDAFIVSDELAATYPRRTVFRDGGRISEIDAIQESIDYSLRQNPAFSGLREGPFTFRIFTQREIDARLGATPPDPQYYFLKRP